jgi:hypothetical protein
MKMKEKLKEDFGKLVVLRRENGHMEALDALGSL